MFFAGWHLSQSLFKKGTEKSNKIELDEDFKLTVPTRPLQFFWFWFGCKEYHHAFRENPPQIPTFTFSLRRSRVDKVWDMWCCMACWFLIRLFCWLPVLSPAGYTVFNEMSTCSKENNEKKNWRHSPYMGRNSARFVGSNPPNGRNGFRRGPSQNCPANSDIWDL